MKELSEHLHKKSDHTVALFWHFVEEYQKIGKVTVEPAKTMIGIAAKTRCVYITRLGKDFIDVCFPFDQPYNDNLCFIKIAQVPGQKQWNHYFRMMKKEDLNKEVRSFMKLAYKEHS